jgi:hypothetical protein
MATAWPHSDLASVCVFGTGAALLGLCELACGARRKGLAGHATSVLACLAAAAGLLAAADGQPRELWLPLVSLGALWGALGLMRLPLAGRLLALLRSGWAHSVALLVFGPAFMVWQAEEVERHTAPPADRFTSAEVERQPVAVRRAVTDAGRTIPLLEAQDRDEADAAARHDEALYLSGGTQAQHVIRTAAAGAATNCGGWVFTGGRYWLEADAVEMILKDNGYRPVSVPQPGDLAVFRGGPTGPWPAGLLVHNGLVRGVAADGQALIESKWGALGRFIHTPEHHPYPYTVVLYYHTDRGGHLLRGLEGR